MSVQWNRVALFCGLSLSTVVACVMIRPRLQNFAALLMERRRPVLSGPIQFGGPAQAPFEPTYQFRRDRLRHGFVLRRRQAIADITRDWVAIPLNFDLHGASKATPAVDETGIYVGADTGLFRKYDFAGKIVWSFDVHTLARGIHATATLTRDTVYFGAYNGWFYALDKQTGAPRWGIALGTAIGSSPLVTRDAVYVTVETPRDGFVAKLNPADGRIQWVSEFLGEQSHPSVVIDEARGVAIVGTNAKTVVAIRTSDGSTAWRAQSGSETKGTGVLVDGKYIVGSLDGQISSLDTATGTRVWQGQVPGRVIGNVTADQEKGLAFLSTSAGLFAFHFADGTMAWSWLYDQTQETRGLYGQSSLVVRAGGEAQLLAQCARRVLCLFDETSGKVRKRFALSGVYSGTPTAFGDHLYVAHSDGGLESLTIHPTDVTTATAQK